jgi:ketosteroid isomerase-like protein
VIAGSDAGAVGRKAVVLSYLDGFRAGDHDQILACLTDDVRWRMPGFFELSGRDAFDGEIENPAFVGHPTIQLVRLVEEGDVVVAEGEVQADMANGQRLDAVFCDVFGFRGDRICELTTYQVNR